MFIAFQPGWLSFCLVEMLAAVRRVKVTRSVMKDNVRRAFDAAQVTWPAEPISSSARTTSGSAGTISTSAVPVIRSAQQSGVTDVDGGTD